jgi:hypothetical protein
VGLTGKQNHTSCKMEKKTHTHAGTQLSRAVNIPSLLQKMQAEMTDPEIVPDRQQRFS